MGWMGRPQTDSSRCATWTSLYNREMQRYVSTVKRYYNSSGGSRLIYDKTFDKAPRHDHAAVSHI